VIFKGEVSVSMTDDSGNEKFLISLGKHEWRSGKREESYGEKRKRKMKRRLPPHTLANTCYHTLTVSLISLRITTGEGEVFGERALIRKEPRRANIVAQGPVVCYYLESSDFYQMLGEFVDKFNKINEMRIIKSCPLFSKLNEVRLRELVTLFHMHRMFPGQRLVCDTHSIVIVMNGMFEDTFKRQYSADSKSGADLEIGSLERGADQAAGALTAVSEECLLAVIMRDALVALFKANDEDERDKRQSLSNRNSSADGSSAPASSSSNESHPLKVGIDRRRQSALAKMEQRQTQFASLDLSQLEVIRAVGKGTFGDVHLCRFRGEGDPVPGLSGANRIVLKCLDKKALVENGQVNPLISLISPIPLIPLISPIPLIPLIPLYHLYPLYFLYPLHPLYPFYPLSGQYEYVRREILALQTFHHPFLADYYGVCMSPRKIFLLLEYIAGGELWSYLYDTKLAAHRNRGKFGGIPVEDAVLYAGTILLALEHCHDLGYCYRDLKPENLLVSANGYIKLIDFGFAKKVPYEHPTTKQVQFRTFTLCGTPDYMAPELVLTQGHGNTHIHSYTLIYTHIHSYTLIYYIPSYIQTAAPTTGLSEYYCMR
jgi:hypothetical protein